MSDIAIRVEHLSKRYRIGSRQAAYGTLRDALASALRSPFRAAQGARRDAAATPFWALRDVSFEVAQGEVLGIIGRNGAGKSTILRIVSGITPPSDGRVAIFGRVGSLLEVGTGFHPELTGRENIYLNGAILGMRKGEIDRKLEAIIEFAEIEPFIDTPVKRYSSGMYMRLAFAVAAHLDPEILIIDEVLAVGDASFQQKCLGKMSDVARSGRTVLFVSHNMLAIQDLCHSVIWLNGGQIVKHGRPDDVVGAYLTSSFSTVTEQAWSDPTTAPGNEAVRLHGARIRPANGSPSNAITIRTTFLIEFDYWVVETDAFVHSSVYLYNEQGVLVFAVSDDRIADPRGRLCRSGLYRETCVVPSDLLNDGMYRVSIEFRTNERGTTYHDDLLIFDVQDTLDRRVAWYGQWNGAIRPLLEWRVDQLQPGAVR